jgi:hypothetical protein
MTQPPDNRHRTPDHNDHDHDHDAGRRRLADAGSLPDVALAESVGSAMVDVADGTPPVPINVWRITDVARPDVLGRGVDLTPQLAVLLLGVFTRPADLVIDLADDVALAGAARAGSRRHLPVHDPTDLAGLAGHTSGMEADGPTRTNQLTGAARLAFMPWPLPAKTGKNPNPATLLTTCRQMLAEGGRAVVALAATEGELPYVERFHLVLRAAHHAGLDYVRHIVVTAPAASPTSSTVADSPLIARDDVGPQMSLLVFASRAGRRG